MGTTIIKNRQVRPKFLKSWLTPKEKPNSSTPRIANTSVLSWNLSMFKFVGQYQHTSKLLFMKPFILQWWHWEGHISQNFQGKTHFLDKRAQISKAAYPLNYFPGLLGKNIKDCPSSKLFLFTSLHALTVPVSKRTLIHTAIHARGFTSGTACQIAWLMISLTMVHRPSREGYIPSHLMSCVWWLY